MSISLFVLALTTSVCRPMAEAAACNSVTNGPGDKRIVRIDEQCKARGSRQQLVQKREPLCSKLEHQCR